MCMFSSISNNLEMILLLSNLKPPDINEYKCGCINIYTYMHKY